MEGPDLTHLLDAADSERPSADVLEGIVRKHRRRRARRARTAATVGLVVALASAGVGIGISHQGPTVSTSSSLGAELHSLRLASGSPVRARSVPAGLGWVDTGTAVRASGQQLSPVASSSPAPARPVATGRLQVIGGSSSSAPSPCIILGCGTGAPYGPIIGSLPLRHLFTRTSDGVTVRVFSALWAEAPLELVPLGASSTGTSSPPTTRSEPPATTSGSTAGGNSGGSGGGGASGGANPGSTTVVVSPPAPAVTVETQPGSPTPTSPTTTSPTATSPTTISPTSTPEPAMPTPALSCAVTSALVVEVSDAGAVGVVTVPLGPSLAQPIDVLSDQVVGIAERAPVAVVVTHTTPGAAAVLADFAGGGSDEMTVVAGWAVLVHMLPVGRTGGTAIRSGTTALGQAVVYALSGSGKVLEQADAPGSGSLAMAVEACPLQGGNEHKTSGSGSSGSTGSLSAGASSGSSGPSGSPSAGASGSSESAPASSGQPNVG